MPGLTITILDPDTSRAQRSARRLRTLLKQEGILACVRETTCYLEISRQGLTGKTPVISVNGRHYQCRNLKDSLLTQFVHQLAGNQTRQPKKSKDTLMKELLSAFERKEPEIVFEWQDAETEAKGWVVINSLRGGAAGGGTRMRKGLDKHEVVSLAKTMEIKFAVSGPQIGGAKSGINFDPADPRKSDVLRRWYKAVMPLLKSYYGTGGDMNVCEVKDVIPITEEYGLWHPQEGIVTGHPDMPMVSFDEAQVASLIAYLRSLER